MTQKTIIEQAMREHREKGYRLYGLQDCGEMIKEAMRLLIEEVKPNNSDCECYCCQRLTHIKKREGLE